ncbi:transport permease protein [Pararhodospirillum oryzae]|uniref:Transport permease protein n=2 Tax=Pararhodospirillum oryzae TaxID=478448 RepID=A0A512H9E3_9PROT|nr:transport permease protein [Pararhodospirillum oryzae]
MAWRDVQARYRGSLLGGAWTVLVPLIMLSVYTFVFGFVLEMKWGASMPGTGNRMESALVLFSGLIWFWMFAEVITRAPGLVRENVNYVTKIVFPLHILPWVAVLASLFNFTVSTAILLIGQVLIMGPPPPTALLAPLIVAPFVLLQVGLGWFLASFGMFVRDVGHVVAVGVQALMFLSPIFYPLEALPEEVRPYYYLNPLTFVVVQFRRILLQGEMPDWTGLGLYSLLAVAVAWLGLAWFLKTRKGFADVI